MSRSLSVIRMGDPPLNDLAIEISNLVKKFRSTTALDDVSFSIKRGEIFGNIGPDGSGKTTLIKILTTLIKPTSGEVRVLGEDAVKNKKKVRSKIGYLSQSFTLYGDLTVKENIEFFSKIHSIDLSKEQTWYERLLEMTNLHPFMDRLGYNLSGGMKQKLSLLCALSKKPQLMILDEPTSGVDPISRRELWKIFYELWKDGITIALSTPYLDEAERCVRVASLENGKLTACDSPEELKKGIHADIFEVYTDDTLKTNSEIKKVKELSSSRIFGEKLIVYSEAGRFDERSMADLLKTHGIHFKHLQRGELSLEDLFMQHRMD